MAIRTRDISDSEWGRAIERAYDQDADVLVERHLETPDGHAAFIGRVTSADGARTYRVVFQSGPAGYDSETIECSCGATKRGQVCWHAAAFQEAIEVQGDNDIASPDTELVESVGVALR